MDFNRHDPPWMTCLLMPHVQYQLLQKPPTAELWCVAHYLFIFGLFIPGIQAVTLAGNSKWCRCINHGPVCGNGGEMTHCRRGLLSHHGVKLKKKQKKNMFCHEVSFMQDRQTKTLLFSSFFFFLPFKFFRHNY